MRHIHPMPKEVPAEFAALFTDADPHAREAREYMWSSYCVGRIGSLLAFGQYLMNAFNIPQSDREMMRRVDGFLRDGPLDCMEVAEALEAPAEPLRLREGSFYRRRDGITRGPVKRCAIGDEQPWEIDDEHGFNCYDHDGHWWPDATDPHVHDLIAEVSAPNTICTPIAPVTVDRNTQIVDPDTGCLTKLGAALSRESHKDNVIAALKEESEFRARRLREERRWNEEKDAEIADLRQQIADKQERLAKIAAWEMPYQGYGTDWGSNGEGDYIRSVANGNPQPRQKLERHP